MDRNIELFEKTAHNILESINTMKSNNYEENYKIILMYSLIDLLSTSIFATKNLSHRDKFILFIDNMTSWKEKDYVSLPQLNLELQKTNEKEFNNIKEVVENKLKQWEKNVFMKNSPIVLQNDITFREISKYWPKSIKRLNSRYKLEFFTHKNLLYSLRNSLIHEMRTLGKQFELFNLDEPHYMHRSIISENQTGEKYLSHGMWELRFPYGFYYNLVLSSIDQVIKYCDDNAINPYNSFNFTSSWMY